MLSHRIDHHIFSVASYRASAGTIHSGFIYAALNGHETRDLQRRTFEASAATRFRT